MTGRRTTGRGRWRPARTGSVFVLGRGVGASSTTRRLAGRGVADARPRRRRARHRGGRRRTRVRQLRRVRRSEPVGRRAEIIAFEIVRAGIWMFEPAAAAPVPDRRPTRAWRAPARATCPRRLPLGGEVEVTLTVDGRCPGTYDPVQIVMVLDTSRSMNFSDAIGRARDAVAELLSRLDPRAAEVGLVTFEEGAALQPQLSRDIAAAGALAVAEDADGDTHLVPGLELARQELTGPRGDAAARRIVLIVTDGVFYDHPRAAADAVRADGLEMWALVLPTFEYNPGFGDSVGRPRRQPRPRVRRPRPVGLAALADGLVRYRAECGLFETITIEDVVPANMRYVDGSAVPRAVWDETARTISWTSTAWRRPTPSRCPTVWSRSRSAPGRPMSRRRRPTATRWGATARSCSPFPRSRCTDRRSSPRAIYLPFLARQSCYRRNKPLDIVLVMDTSSSMTETAPAGGTKLAAAQGAAHTFLGLLRWSTDRRRWWRSTRQHGSTGVAAHRRPGDGRPGHRRASPRPQGTHIDLGLVEARRALAAAGGRRRGRSRWSCSSPTASTTPVPRRWRSTADRLKDAGAPPSTPIGLGAQEIDAALLARVATTPDRYYPSPSADDLAAIYRPDLRAHRVRRPVIRSASHVRRAPRPGSHLEMGRSRRAGARAVPLATAGAPRPADRRDRRHDAPRRRGRLRALRRAGGDGDVSPRRHTTRRAVGAHAGPLRARGGCRHGARRNDLRFGRQVGRGARPGARRDAARRRPAARPRPRPPDRAPSRCRRRRRDLGALGRRRRRVLRAPRPRGAGRHARRALRRAGGAPVAVSRPRGCARRERLSVAAPVRHAGDGFRAPDGPAGQRLRGVRPGRRPAGARDAAGGRPAREHERRRRRHGLSRQSDAVHGLPAAGSPTDAAVAGGRRAGDRAGPGDAAGRPGRGRRRPGAGPSLSRDRAVPQRRRCGGRTRRGIRVAQSRHLPARRDHPALQRAERPGLQCRHPPGGTRRRQAGGVAGALRVPGAVAARSPGGAPRACPVRRGDGRPRARRAAVSAPPRGRRQRRRAPGALPRLDRRRAAALRHHRRPGRAIRAALVASRHCGVGLGTALAVRRVRGLRERLHPRRGDRRRRCLHRGPRPGPAAPRRRPAVVDGLAHGDDRSRPPVATGRGSSRRGPRSRCSTPPRARSTCSIAPGSRPPTGRLPWEETASCPWTWRCAATAPISPTWGAVASSPGA